MEWIQAADNAVLGWIQQHLAGPAGDWLMPLITALGNAGAVWIVAAVVLLFMKKWRKTGVEIFLSRRGTPPLLWRQRRCCCGGTNGWGYRRWRWRS